VALVAGVAALAVAEIALRIAAPVRDPYAEIKLRRVVNQYIRSARTPHLSLRTDVEPGLPGMAGPSRFTMNNLGFRGDSIAVPKTAGELRVFLLGGSSTECFYLDDTVALDAVTQRELQRLVGIGAAVRVYGAGMSGARSDDHLSLFVHRVAHLEPDVIVVFAGLNDLTAAVTGYDFLHYVARDARGDTAAAPLGLLRLARLAATEFQLPRRAFYLLKGLTPSPELELLQSIPLRSNYREAVALRRRAPLTSEEPEIPASAYAVNLRSLIGAARANAVGVVLMTQQTTWASTVDPRVEDWQWMTYRNGKVYDPSLMDRALDVLNDTARQVALDLRVPMYDLARSIPKSTDYFYDDVHFNVRGARRAGQELAAAIHAARRQLLHE
jgi:lysophospholipase L1-like esterase